MQLCVEWMNRLHCHFISSNSTNLSATGRTCTLDESMEERMQIMRNVGQNRDSLVDRLSGSMVWGSGFSPTGKQSTHTHICHPSNWRGRKWICIIRSYQLHLSEPSKIVRSQKTCRKRPTPIIHIGIKDFPFLASCGEIHLSSAAPETQLLQPSTVSETPMVCVSLPNTHKSSQAKNH